MVPADPGVNLAGKLVCDQTRCPIPRPQNRLTVCSMQCHPHFRPQIFPRLRPERTAACDSSG